MERLAGELGIAGRVRFLGGLPHAQVLEWMQKAAMLVLPGIRTPTGREEGLGMATLEAAATGLPVIGSRLGGIPETVAEGETGFLVPERDVNSHRLAHRNFAGRRAAAQTLWAGRPRPGGTIV